MDAKDAPEATLFDNSSSQKPTQGRQGLGASASSAVSAAHVILFWVLTGLALAVFIPSVLVPLWVQDEKAHESRKAMEAMVGGLEQQVARNDEKIQALQNDPLVNERLIRRELNYRADSEERVRWAPEQLAHAPVYLSEPLTPDDGPTVLNDEPPAWLATLVHWLPAWPWRALFAESPNRTLMLISSGGLLAAAFLLYGQMPRRGQSS